MPSKSCSSFPKNWLFDVAKPSGGGCLRSRSISVLPVAHPKRRFRPVIQSREHTGRANQAQAQAAVRNKPSKWAGVAIATARLEHAARPTCTAHTTRARGVVPVWSWLGPGRQGQAKGRLQVPHCLTCPGCTHTHIADISYA